MKPKEISDEDFIAAWRSLGSPQAVSNRTGMSIRAVYSRRNRLYSDGIPLQTVDPRGRESTYSPRIKFERSRKFEIKDGHVIVFSDPHFYPDHNSVGMSALLTLIKELKPKAVFCGGDALDATQLSRFDPTRGWHTPPSVREQVDCLESSMGAIKRAAGKGAITAMALGNHDSRFSRYLAVHAPEWEDMPGTRLEDFIPAWPLSWTININGNTIIRHRNQAGMLHLQGMKAGCHYVHGHLHRLNVHAAAQYGKYVYSVDCGSFADPNSDAFDYAEGGADHVQGFAVFTYRKHEMMWPELCYVSNGIAYFRGRPV